LLRQYERARKADLAMVGQAGDALQRLFNHTDPAVRTLRNWGMNGFERSGAIKEWVARRAMGAAPQSDRHVNQPAKHTT
jgi:2-polyprenyl-6-methoxyphenol hydroxylase-like FAD-dependent oxidoreductase